MQQWGAIFGLFLGYFLLRSFWGALLGFWLGQQFSQRLQQQHFSRDLPRDATPFLQALFATLGHLNKVKGRITHQDIQFAEQLMDQLQLDGEARAVAQHAYSRGKQPQFPLRQWLQAFQPTATLRPDWLQLFLQIQRQAAIEAGVEQPAVQQTLWSIVEELPLAPRQLQHLLSLLKAPSPFGRAGFNPYHFNGQASQQQQESSRFDQASQAPDRSQTMTLTQACQVLGIKASDEPQSIKRAYRKLMFQHHPDKLAAQGLSPAKMEQAKQQAQTIQAAYDLIKRHLNFK